MELKQILSVTKPVATKDFVCAWSHPPNEHTVSRGRKYVRCVWEPKEGKIQSDHICVECWTSK